RRSHIIRTFEIVVHGHGALRSWMATDFTTSPPTSPSRVSVRDMKSTPARAAWTLLPHGCSVPGAAPTPGCTLRVQLQSEVFHNRRFKALRLQVERLCADPRPRALPSG
ncbi:hypothetical protein H1C71_038510, partial [Ictidomys tridecemlineatus]